MYAHGETVTRQRPTAVLDPYSGETTDLSWTTPDTLDIEGVAIQPGPSAESVETDRSRLDIDYTLYMPYGADVAPIDRLVVRGDVCTVEGKPADWRNPYTGSEPGTVVEVRRVAG